MVLKMINLIVVSVFAIVVASATELTVSRMGRNVFVETGQENFAMSAQARASTDDKTIAYNGGLYTTQTQDCKLVSGTTEEIDPEKLSIIHEVRIRYSELEKKSTEEIAKLVSGSGYTWSTSFSRDQQSDQSATKIDEATTVYSSPDFPNELAKLVTSNDVVGFVYQNGRVSMKATHCLGKNEKILVEAAGSGEFKGEALKNLDAKELAIEQEQS